MAQGRTKKATINAVFGLLSYVTILIITFFSQRVFVRRLGYEYLGLNSLLTTVISALSITEIGIGMAIAFSLYKPLAENDEQKISALIRLYRKIYAVIGAIVLVLGLAVIPALPVLTKYNFGLNQLIVPYLLFLSNSVFSYLLTYNQTLLAADQKNFIISIITSVTRIIMGGLQIGILYLCNNYVLYLAIMLACNTASNVVMYFIVRHKYPYIKHGSGTIGAEEKKSIKKNVSALIYHRIGNYLVTGTDNLIISGFLGTAFSGYYSNYMLITNSITGIITNFFVGITSGFGNLIATSEREHVLTVFKRVRYLNYLIFAVGTVGFCVLANNFIEIWVSSADGLQPWYFIVCFALNFYLTGYSSILGNIRAAAGVFAPDKYLHIVIAVLNLIISMTLVNFIGITGVVLGTTICLIIKECIVLPHIGSKYIYGGKTWHYYARFFYDFFVMVAALFLSGYLCTLFALNNAIADFIVKALVCVGISVSLIILTSFHTDEFKYYIGIITNLLRKIKRSGSANEV